MEAARLGTGAGVLPRPSGPGDGPERRSDHLADRDLGHRHPALLMRHHWPPLQGAMLTRGNLLGAPARRRQVPAGLEPGGAPDDVSLVAMPPVAHIGGTGRGWSWR
ncbi:hypothetical protein ACRAWD_06495 [Caulobacter segnis]